VIPFLVGLILFFGSHSVSIVAEPWRDRMVARLGESRWQGLYSLVSLLGFGLIVWGFGPARQSGIQLYLPPLWLHHVTFLLMLPVFPLLIATYLPGRIQALTRHPMLLATILWSAGHLLANGGFADVLLFGSFLIWAVDDRLSMARRVQRPIQQLPAGRLNDVIAAIGGLALYALFIFWAHARLFGVSPLAGIA